MRYAIHAILLLPIMLFAQYRYHTYDSTKALVDSLVANHPAIIEKHVYGTSVHGRELFAVKISDNVSVDENEPEISFDAGIHGVEWTAQEMVVMLMQDLCALYGADTQITRLVDTREIWIVPHFNPDARAETIDSRGCNANGVNLNRDFGYLWDAMEYSTRPFSQPETQAFCKWFLENHFSVSQSNHDGLEEISFCWGFRYVTMPRDSAAFSALGSAYASMVGGGYPLVLGCATTLAGTGDAFLYGSRGTIAFCVEVADAPTGNFQNPLLCPAYYAKHKPAMLYMADRAGHGVWGEVTDSTTGEPVSASIWVSREGNELFPVYNDPAIGDYHKVILPGVYSVTAFSNGYETAIKTGVIVPDTGAVKLDFALSPSTDANGYGFQVMACRVRNSSNYPNDGRDSVLTSWSLGRPDGRGYSLRKNGYIVIDMGDTVYDLTGPDLRIVEADASVEGYSVKVSLDPWGSFTGWRTIGRDSGSASFDLADSGVAIFRYVHIQDDNDDADSLAAYAGFDLDAVAAIRALDTVSPSILSATAWAGPSRIDLLYSEPVEDASSGEPSNYSLTGGLAVDSAVLMPDKETVRFTLSGAMVENTSYTLTVSNVRDRARTPNTIIPNSQVSFTYEGVTDSIGFIQDGTACDADISVWRALRLIIPSGTSGDVQSVAFRHVAAGGQIRYGVYTNAGNAPGVCMDSTDWRDASPGWQKIDLTHKDFTVTAGDTLWISVRASTASTVLCYSNSGTGTHARSISNSGGSGLPTPWVSANVAYTDYCGYAVIRSSGTTATVSQDPAENTPAMRASPNPFNPMTVLDIRYRTTEAGPRIIDLKIFSINGRLVKDLSFVRPRSSSVVRQSVPWNAMGMPSGLYLARVKIGKDVIRKPLVLVR